MVTEDYTGIAEIIPKSANTDLYVSNDGSQRAKDGSGERVDGIFLSRDGHCYGNGSLHQRYYLKK